MYAHGSDGMNAPGSATLAVPRRPDLRARGLWAAYRAGIDGESAFIVADLF